MVTWGVGGDGGGDGGGAGIASWWMVTSVSVHAALQYARHVARPCGGEVESSEVWNAQSQHAPSPSRSLSAVVLGAPILDIIHELIGIDEAPQSGSQ